MTNLSSCRREALWRSTVGFWILLEIRNWKLVVSLAEPLEIFYSVPVVQWIEHQPSKLVT